MTDADKIRYFDMLEEMTTQECDSVVILHSDPEFEDPAAYAWAVEVSGDWTTYIEMRIWGATRYQALSNAYAQWHQGYITGFEAASYCPRNHHSDRPA